MRRWWERNFDEKNAISKRTVPDALALTEPLDSPRKTLYQTRVKVPKVPEDRWHDAITYHELEQLGKGAIGSVSRVMDLQSGRIMAMKIIAIENGKEKNIKETAKVEVELIANLRHVSLSLLSCLGHLLTVMCSLILLTLCIPKVGKWGRKWIYSCQLRTLLCETIQAPPT